MDKYIVLNICGVKSLGGLNVVAAAINAIEKSEYKIILLHNNNMTENMLLKTGIQQMETNLNRYFHPYLNIFLNKKDLNTINKSAAIIHFGNFGFKTKNKSYTLIQNLLPLEVKNVKNIILKYFISRSFKQSNHIVYQLEHVAKKINTRFESKLIKIGVIEKFVKDVNDNIGIIGIRSQIRNKNSSFMEKVFERITVELPELKITKFISEEGQSSLIENTFSLIDGFSKHSIYFHTSFIETVGLPLYEASSAGLFIVAPDSEYMEHFDTTNSIKYKSGDIDSATACLKEALNLGKNNFSSLSYKENWIPVLKSI